MKDCIESTYSKIPTGYARKWHNNKHWYHHRLVWTQHNGDIPQGYIVRHKCDNPSCINIDHLELGTLKDNTLDMLQRNRQYSKLTEAQVLDIRAKQGHISRKELAYEYNVSRSLIDKVMQRKMWKHI